MKDQILIIPWFLSSWWLVYHLSVAWGSTDPLVSFLLAQPSRTHARTFHSLDTVEC